jgi:hypothetical protein
MKTSTDFARTSSFPDFRPLFTFKKGWEREGEDKYFGFITTPLFLETQVF